MKAELCGDEHDEWWLYLGRDGLTFAAELTPGVAATMIDWLFNTGKGGCASRTLDDGTEITLYGAECTVKTIKPNKSDIYNVADSMLRFNKEDLVLFMEASDRVEV